MPGLLTQQPGAAAGVSPSGPARPQRTGGLAPSDATTQLQDGGDAANASPEEQRAYDQFVDNAYSVIYDDKTLPQILQSLQGDGNPVDGLANVAVMVVTRVQDSAEQAGQPVPPDVLFNAGVEILEDLADLAGKAGVYDFSEQEIEGAMFQAMDLYREQKGRDGGQAAPQIQQDFNEIVALDQAGKLDQLAPGLTEKFGAGAR